MNVLPVTGLTCGSMNSTVMKVTQTIAMMPIGRLQRPRFHGPGWNRSPCISRSRVGSTYAM